MSILRGEQAKVVTIFGTVTVPSGARSRSAYLARPDLGGEWPTVVVLGGTERITSPVKEVCRRLARQGFAVLAPEAVGAPPDLDRYVDYIANPTADWSNAEYGYGLLGLPAGREVAIAAAGDDAAIDAVAVVGLPEDADALGAVRVPALGLLGTAAASPEAIERARNSAPRTTWVVYDGAGDDWWDDAAPGYDDAASGDALMRLHDFFTEHLPSVR